MLSRKFPGRPLRRGLGRERICAQRGRLGGCIVEQSLRTQTRRPRAPAAPVRDRTLVRNRSTEALLNWIWRTQSRPAISAGGGLFAMARSTHSAATATVVFELRFQLIELRLLFSRQHRLHVLIELESRAHQ